MPDDTRAELLPVEQGLGYHDMASRGRCDWTHLREAVAEATMGSRTNAPPFDPDFYPGHQMVSGINYNSLDRIVTAFVDAALRAAPPLPPAREPTEAMVEAGENVLFGADEDMRNYVSGVTTDWDYSMEAEAVWRAMYDAALPTPTADDAGRVELPIGHPLNLRPSRAALEEIAERERREAVGYQHVNDIPLGSTLADDAGARELWAKAVAIPMQACQYIGARPGSSIHSALAEVELQLRKLSERALAKPVPAEVAGMVERLRLIAGYTDIILADCHRTMLRKAAALIERLARRQTYGEGIEAAAKAGERYRDSHGFDSVAHRLLTEQIAAIRALAKQGD